MTDSLHDVENQAQRSFDNANRRLKPRQQRVIIVEYDTSEPSRWVPYPVGRTELTTLFEQAGYSSLRHRLSFEPTDRAPRKT